VLVHLDGERASLVRRQAAGFVTKERSCVRTNITG